MDLPEPPDVARPLEEEDALPPVPDQPAAAEATAERATRPTAEYVWWLGTAERAPRPTAEYVWWLGSTERSTRPAEHVW
eukprot:16226450-Heterocapsa_arctica.AAC.1